MNLVKEFGLWSLYDVLRIHAANFTKVCELLGRFSGRTLAPAIRSDCAEFLDSLKRIEQTAQALHLGATRYLARQARARLSIDSPPEAMMEQAKSVSDAFKSDLESTFFFHLSNEAAQLYEPANPLLPASVSTAFPLSVDEYNEAARCLAFCRYPATVFHCMRALEPALNALAAELGVQAEHRNWQNIIDEIEKAIRASSAARQGENWKEAERFYSAAASNFWYFKNAWRNHVMHLRSNYSHEQTQAVFDHVGRFLEALSEEANRNS